MRGHCLEEDVDVVDSYGVSLKGPGWGLLWFFMTLPAPCFLPGSPNLFSICRVPMLAQHVNTIPHPQAYFHGESELSKSLDT